MFVLELDEQVVKMFENKDVFTGYEVAKLVGIRPQMVYNYIQKGFIQHIEVNGQNLVEKNEAIRWTSKYLSKKGS